MLCVCCGGEGGKGRFYLPTGTCLKRVGRRDSRLRTRGASQAPDLGSSSFTVRPVPVPSVAATHPAVEGNGSFQTFSVSTGLSTVEYVEMCRDRFPTFVPEDSEWFLWDQAPWPEQEGRECAPRPVMKTHGAPVSLCSREALGRSEQAGNSPAGNGGHQACTEPGTTFVPFLPGGKRPFMSLALSK